MAAGRAGLGRPLGRTAAAASVSASADGRRLAFTRDDGAVAVLDVATGAELYRLRLARALPPTRTQLSADGTQLVTQSGAMLKSWSLPSKPVTPRNAPLEAAPTALALDRASDVLAVGLASGQLQLVPVAASARGSLSFFGHRGPITAAASERRPRPRRDRRQRRHRARLGSRFRCAHGRRHAAGRCRDQWSRAQRRRSYVASAAGRVVRVATVADGRVITEVQAESAVTALAFAPNAAAIAVGDAAGAVSIAPLGGGRRATVRLGAPAAALAFAPDGSRLAVGDSSGTITLVDTASGESAGKVRHWSQPIRWLEFRARTAARCSLRRTRGCTRWRSDAGARADAKQARRLARGGDGCNGDFRNER